MQNKSVKISVIMPVFNVANYLDKAIMSVLNQDFKDFEFILVNDGSTDDSLKILRNYEKKDNRIVIIDQKNMGAHMARNNGIDIAKGEYLCFFDSDDYIDKNMLRELYEVINKYGSDLVISGFNINTYYDDKNYFVRAYTPWICSGDAIENYNSKTNFRKYAYKNFDKNMFYPPWNKMYRSSYIKDNNFKFPITYRDDFPFVLDVIKDIEKITFTKNTYYNFIRKRSDSETQKYVKNLYEKREEEHEKMISLYRYWGLLNDTDSYEMISRRYIDRVIECIVNLYNKECNLTDTEKCDEIKKYLYNENTLSSIKSARPKKFYLRCMYIPIKMKSVFLCSLMGRFINFVKSKNIILFSKLKMNR